MEAMTAFVFFFVIFVHFAVTKPEKHVSVVFRCSMLYIDFEGRSDGESIKRILSLVNPRNLVSSARLPLQISPLLPRDITVDYNERPGMHIQELV